MKATKFAATGPSMPVGYVQAHFQPYFQRYQARIFFAVLGIVTAWVLLQVELPLLLGWNPEWENKIDGYRLLLHVHALAGCVALFAAPVQFLSTLRTAHPNIHRLIGRLYAFSIVIAAPIAIWIACNQLAADEKWAACTQAVVWLLATIAAVVTAIRRQFAAHRMWIMRSYALTCTFVLSRFLVDVLHYHPNPALGGNAGFIVLSSLFVLFCADWVSGRNPATFA